MNMFLLLFIALLGVLKIPVHKACLTALVKVDKNSITIYSISKKEVSIC
jgi:hypothetical protein